MARTASSDDAALAAALPLDLDLDEDELLLQESVRGFLARRWPPAAVRATLESPRRLDREQWREAADMGWIAILVPERHGGLGGSLAQLAVVATELGRAVNPAPFLGCFLSAAALAASRTQDGPAGELLAALAAGTATAAWCGPEPAHGDWSERTVATTARRDGAGVVLDGRKRLVPDADLADRLVVAARSDNELVHVLVPADTDGVVIEPARALDLTRRFCNVRLDGVRVDPGMVVAGEAQPRSAFDAALRVAELAVAFDAIGAAERLLEMTVAYAKDRVAFERPIGSYQAVKHKCADMLLRVEASTVAARYAALALQERTADAERALAVAGAYVPEACSDVAGEALQIHGGIGFTWEHDLHLFLRRIKTDEALFGDGRNHRERLARTIL
jgi:alkylation response protein AidB-like acyl-CoA dehydrogenase